MRQRSQLCCLQEHNHTADFPYKARLNVAISRSYDLDKRVTRGHTHAPPKMWETPAIQPPVGVFCSAINGCLIFFHRRNSSGINDFACKIISFLSNTRWLRRGLEVGAGLAWFATRRAVHSGCYFYTSKLIHSHLQSQWPYLRGSLSRWEQVIHCTWKTGHFPFILLKT